MTDHTPDESQPPPTPTPDRPEFSNRSGVSVGGGGTGNENKLVLPDWMRTREPELQLTWQRRLRDQLGDHGVKTVAVLIMIAIFVPSGWMIWDVLFAPPGTPIVLSQGMVYARSHAATYHSGEAGIDLPEARPTTSFSADQVSEALSDVRQALVASRLDPRMLSGHDPDGFLALLAPASRSDVAADFTDRTGPGYVSQISTAIPLLDEVEPRVKGEISYRERLVNGAPVLEVTSSFTWVYPFETRYAAAGRHLVTVQDTLNWYVVPESHPDPDMRGLHLIDGSWTGENVACEPYERGFLNPSTRADDNGCDQPEGP